MASPTPYRSFVVFLLAFCLPLAAQATLLWNPPRGTPGDLWADLVLGQTDQAPDGSGVFVLNSAFGERKSNEATAGTIFYAGGVFVDRSGGPGNDRFYVWDGNNSRVLGFTNPDAFTPNAGVGQFGYNADMVLGQPDFSHCACNGDNNYQNYANNFPYDLTPPNASQLCGEGAIQQSTSEGGIRANMAGDSQGNLYVPDPGNNRVLRFEKSSLVSGAMGPAASAVWGQPNMTSFFQNQGFSAPNNNTLNFSGTGYGGAGGVAVDSQGNLWVADYGNNRVLRFSNPNAPSPGVPSSTADLVIGQSNFNTTSYTSDLSHTQNPIAVRVDKAGNVFVAGGGKILVFPPSAYLPGGVPTNGATASFAMTNYLVGPTVLEIGNDDTGTGVESLWETDTSAAQIVMFNVNCPAMTYTPQKVLLENILKNIASNDTNATGGDGLTFNYVYPVGTSGQLYAASGPAGLAVDSNDNVFMCYINGNNGVWRFPSPIPDLNWNGSNYVVNLPAGEAHSADVDVFKQNQFGLNNRIGSANVGLVGQGGSGVAVAQNMSTSQIIVSDTYRLMYWNLPAAGPQALGNGAMPTGYAGVDQQATPSLVYNQGPTVFGRMKVDQATSPQHLWVEAANKTGNATEVQVYNLPLSGNATPTAYLTTNIRVLGTGPVSYLDWTNGEAGEGGQTGLSSVAPSWDASVSYLWADDEGHGRVFRIRDPLGTLNTCNGSAGPCVDIVIGQKNANNNDCSEQGTLDASKNCNGEKSPIDKYCLSKPGAVNLDHKGNLFVSDSFLETTGNARLLEYDSAHIQNNGTVCYFGAGGTGIGADRVYDRSGDYSQGGVACAPGGPCFVYPFDAAFPSDDHMMVVGAFQGTNFPVAVPAPLSNTDPGNPQYPWTTLKDFSSAVYSLTFDNQDNLYTTDLDRSRVLVYLQPFPTLTATPTGTLTPAPTSTPTITPTPDCFQAAAAPIPTPPGGFYYPYALCVDKNHNYLFVDDAANKRAVVYTYTAGSLPVYSTAIGSPGQFSFLHDIGVDNAGNLYMIDYDNNWVQKYSFDGTTATLLTTFGPADGMASPRGIWVDPSGSTVYVTTESGTVFRYDGGGSAYTKTATFSVGPDIPTGIVKAGNDIYIVDSSNSTVLEVTETPGSPPTYSAKATVNLGAGNGVANNLFFIKTDGIGHFFLSSANDFILMVFQQMDATHFNMLYDPQILAVLTGVEVDQYGNVDIAESNDNKVVQMRGCLAPPTATPTITNTPTVTPSFTPTGTATFSPTATPSSTPSPTATATPSSTPTQSPTVTPTATVTSTPTFSPTWTPSSTVTATPTEGCHEPAFYPNPCPGSLHLHFSPCDEGREMHVKIFTVVDRKVLDKDFAQVPVGVDVTLELKDNWGTPLANGLYYLVLDGPRGRTIGKLLILR